MSRYDVFQQTYMISKIASAMRGFKGTQQDLQLGFQHVVPMLLQDLRLSEGWEVVWGPVIWKNEPSNSKTGLDHAWFVTKNKSIKFKDRRTYPTHVIAIAGAGKSSGYDWAEVNFNVNRVVDFTAWVKSGITTAPSGAVSIDEAKSYISLGTATASHTILNTKSPAGAANPELSLLDFVKQLPNGSSKLILTGHSMGAAIAPTVGLALISSSAIGSSIMTHTYPTAGASPGNESFAKEFAQKFPEKGEDVGYKVWNCNIFNTRDVVPQHWCTDAGRSPKQNLDNIQGIYGTPPPRDLRMVVELLRANAKGVGVVYFPLRGREFHHPLPAAVPPTIDEFMGIARAQHASAYDTFLRISWTARDIQAHQGVMKVTPAVAAARAELGIGRMISGSNDEDEAIAMNEASEVVTDEIDRMY